MVNRQRGACWALLIAAGLSAGCGAHGPQRQLLAPPPDSQTPTATPPLQPCAPPSPTAGLTYETQIENQLLDMINEMRQKANAPALTRDEGHLQDAARERVVERASSLFGLPIAQRLTKWCVPFKSAGAIAKPIPPGSYPAPDFITNVTGFAAAKAILMNPALNQIGIAVYRGGPSNRLYVALILIATP